MSSNTIRLDTSRPDPDALVALAAREGHGRLKVFLGAAPGVGKTWEMLAAGRQRAADKLDVVIGVVETHGRAETEAQIGSLPVLPRRAIAYRGQVLHEFDLDAALVRRPGLILIDELAHTNAPGSRHAKRWEDVAELLATGIDVWATLNVQHLESLNDAVARITGVRVTETLPDRVLQMADAIELIDLPTAELQARLTEGRIYRPDVARRALEGFFREGNLVALREMALRRAAEHVDADVRDYMRSHDISGPWPAGERVMVLVGPDRSSEPAIRHAKRLADALRAPLIALHVERRGDTLEVHTPLALAAQLGAEIETRAAGDVVAAALDVAIARNVTQIVIGRGRPPLLRRLTGHTLSMQLLRRAPAYAMHIVPAEPVGPRRRRLALPIPVWGWAVSVALVAGVTCAGLLVGRVVPQEAIGMVYLAAVVASALLAGMAPALATAALGFLSWNFFLIPPRFTFSIDSHRDLIAIVVFAGVALATGGLAGRVRAEARGAQARIEGLRRISAFSRKLGEPTTEPDLLAEIARQAASLVKQALVMTAAGDDIAIRVAEPPATVGANSLDEGSWAAARWAFANQEPTGRGTATLPSADWRFLPLRTVRGKLGVLGVRAPGLIDPSLLQAVEALADQASVALERVRLARDSAQHAAQSETQKLRTALLNSLSHDLRTPLAGIRAGAGTLAASWEELAPAIRRDLLHSIEEDVARMTRFLGNIMDMTRLESGEIVPRLGPVSVQEVVEAAIARLSAAPLIAANLPDLHVLADATLLEQVLFNVLDNAVKYSPTGALIRVSGSVGGSVVELAVADEGSGIAPGDLPHVFDSFYRAHRGDRVAAGTGLGLAIARGLVEAMGGSSAAASPRLDLPRDGNPGTIVTIRLPLAL